MDVSDTSLPPPQNAPPTTQSAATAPPSLSSQTAEGAMKSIAFGSIAGCVGKFIEYPFDTVKVRLQSQPDGQPLRYTGPVDCFRQSWRAEGVTGLYRGISAPLVGAAVETSSLFFSYRVIQDFALATWAPASGELSLPALAACGALSGAFTSLLLTPIELVKCKMQVPSPSGKPGPLAIIAAVYRHQGIIGFWHGQLGTLIRETGGSAAWFGSYEGVKLGFRKVTHHGPADTPMYQQMVAGAVAGMAYNLLFYPADTIKSRMQTEDVSTGGRRRGFGAAARVLWQQHGVKGMYRGCGITVGRAAPSSAFIFTVYEALMKYFG
ncbi:mitochondrial carrier [Trichodelitschia bisporula]|uniref:Mitochondrial carrier n=1 Tax=Trichodelitschia bisporula TaxID=703511 RepID=A0A6G1I795_9PEZI|nr:mitochondrial carrier [Trichodelitschia bisporula]